MIGNGEEPITFVASVVEMTKDGEVLTALFNEDMLIRLSHTALDVVSVIDCRVLTRGEGLGGHDRAARETSRELH